MPINNINLYNYFDKIVCINLKLRPDRYLSATKIFQKLNINVLKNIII